MSQLNYSERRDTQKQYCLDLQSAVAIAESVAVVSCDKKFICKVRILYKIQKV